MLPSPHTHPRLLSEILTYKAESLTVPKTYGMVYKRFLHFTAPTQSKIGKILHLDIAA